jgi:tetratricopeptide (TPR) repeat protein
MAANAGVLGALGFVLVVAWVIRRAVSLRHGDLLGAAFAAAAVAYFVQSLVSIDELTLRVALWTGLGGLAAASMPASALSPDLSRAARAEEAPAVRRLRTATAGLLVAAGVGTSVWWATGWLAADLRVERAEALFNAGRPGPAATEMKRALAFRDEISYRRAYALGLGLAALDNGARGAKLMEDMRAVNAYLRRVPDPRGVRTAARITHHWGAVRPAADERALRLYDRAQLLDPHNVLLAVERAEVLLDLGRPHAARAALESRAEWIGDRAPELWGVLSVARLKTGDHTGAVEAAARGERIASQDCRVLVAEELLRVEISGSPPPEGRTLVLHFACEPGLYGWFLDQLPADARRHYA